jgi:acetoin utilization deacetylase AcuC-like enzyme
VHHGNGTQQIFEADPSVYYASLHQSPLYPGTGTRAERGVGDGAGATLNCPLPPRSGEVEWMQALERDVLPELERFAPQFLLVSAGYDGHARDPLAQTELETESYAKFARHALDFARAHCGGRVVALLEGGYDLEALAESAHAHVAEWNAR